MNMLLYHLQKLQVLRSETIVMESILILFFYVAHGLLCWFVHVNWWLTTFWTFYTLYYLIKLFWLTPIHLHHFRDRLCYISRKSLLPIHHQIAQELVLKFHPIEVPKTLVNFQPFQDGSFSQNMGKQMKKLILLRRLGFNLSIGSTSNAASSLSQITRFIWSSSFSTNEYMSRAHFLCLIITCKHNQRNILSVIMDHSITIILSSECD